MGAKHRRATLKGMPLLYGNEADWAAKSPEELRALRSDTNRRQRASRKVRWLSLASTSV